MTAIENGLTRHSEARRAAALTPLWDWDLSPVATRLRSRLGWTPELVQLVEREYRHFVALAALEPGVAFGMRGPVDEFWHEHLLFTRDYHRFCDAIAGGYIHHMPNVSRTGEESASYPRTLAMLKFYFGDVPEEIWKSGTALDGDECDHCASCDKVEATSFPEPAMPPRLLGEHRSH